MKINEVEAAVGVTKKNIRFYEEEGLISPRREPGNGYRSYSEADVERLRRIKLLRKLGVPLEEIRQMQAGRITVADGMRRHLVTLEREQRSLEQSMELCRKLKDREERLESLDAAGLLEQMENTAEIHVYLLEKGRYKVILEGKNLGALIGRRGETLDAIQQLTGYAVNHGQSKRVRIHVDAEGYRAKREESLVRLAQKVAGKVVKYRRNVTLEPMNAYERHVIHTALQETPDITTYSIGTEPNRRTVVAYSRGEHR